MSVTELFRTFSQPISRLSFTGWRAYAFAVGMILGAVVVRWALPEGLGSRVPFPTFFLAVFMSAWVGGWRAGLLASALSIVCGLTIFPITRPPWERIDNHANKYVRALPTCCAPVGDGAKRPTGGAVATLIIASGKCGGPG